MDDKLVLSKCSEDADNEVEDSDATDSSDSDNSDFFSSGNNQY